MVNASARYVCIMQSYDSREWFRALALHRSDTFRKLLPMLALVGAFTGGVAYVEVAYLQLSDDHVVSKLPLMHSLLGFAISMLLVFRTNTAYDRWWEGRKLWGELVNVSRNTAIKTAAVLPAEDAANRKQMAALLGLFALELQNHLRSERTRMELDEDEDQILREFDTTKHLPSQLSRRMHALVHTAYREGRLTGDQLVGLSTDLTAFMNICGACERIKNTPIPYSYATFIKKFVFVYVLTLPFGYALALGYIAIPVVIFVFYVLASLEIIAEEIEEPFGTDSNDLPLDRLSRMIAANVKDILT